MATFGKILKSIGYIIMIAATLWGYYLCLSFIKGVFGIRAMLLALLLGPVTFITAPLYAGFKLHDWQPFIISYGGSALAIALMIVGSILVNRFGVKIEGK